MRVEEEGGLIRTPKNEDSRRHFRPGRRETRNTLKTSSDFAAERQAAQQRWVGMPPLVAAREMVAEAELAPELVGQVSALLSEIPEEKLAEMVNSGELFQQLAELAAS